jgi:hypothetical protein
MRGANLLDPLPELAALIDGIEAHRQHNNQKADQPKHESNAKHEGLSSGDRWV